MAVWRTAVLTSKLPGKILKDDRYQPSTAWAFYLLRDEEILCEAATGPLIEGVRELGILTHEPYRGRGYTTLTCARLIQEMEQVGERPFWNCATTNLASAAVARKLGFVNEKVFEFVWYRGVDT